MLIRTRGLLRRGTVHFLKLTPAPTAATLGWKRSARYMADVSADVWDAVRGHAAFPNAPGSPLSDEEGYTELATKQDIHRAAASYESIGFCSGSDLTESADMQLTCTPGQGLSCSDSHGGYFLSRAGYVLIPPQLRPLLRGRRVVLGPGVSLPTLFCFHRRIQPPLDSTGDPLNVAKVGLDGDSALFSFSWDQRAPPGCGGGLHGRMFLKVGASLDPESWTSYPNGGILLKDPSALTLAPWTQCMEPRAAGETSATSPLQPVILVCLPQCLQGLAALPFERAAQKLNAKTKNGELIRAIIGGFSVASSRRHLAAVAYLDAVLAVLLSAPPLETAYAVVPLDVGASVLELLEGDLGLNVVEGVRAILLLR